MMAGQEGGNMSYSKLKGRIIEKFGSQRQFASQMSVSNTTLTRKMTGKVGFSQSDIVEWCKALDIDRSEIGLYFFSDESSKV